MAQKPRFRSLLLVLATVLATVLAVLVPAGVAQAGRGYGPQLTVMTRNLYLGTGLINTVAATSCQELVDATTTDWQNVLATNFRVRARALAAEVGRARPDVLGLQEVTLWRDQSPADSVSEADCSSTPGPMAPIVPNARHVVLDFLAILRSALAARGLGYTPVVTSVNADAEAPREGGYGLVDLRITDRDVILVRNGLLPRFSNPQHGHYLVQLSLPTIYGGATFTRGWTSIDYRYAVSNKVRVFNTHLEVAEAAPIRDVQAGEAKLIIGSSPYPVIAVGDYNSSPNDTPPSAYTIMTAAPPPMQDAWTAAHPTDDGFTCCQAELLDNAVGQETQRIDLILSTVNWPVDRVFRTGSTPFRAGPPPLWASDHFGVTARFTFAQPV